MAHHGSRRVHLCIDNTTVLRCIAGQPSDSSQHEFLAIRQLVGGLGERTFSLQWTPGHTKIEGNEAADKEAKKGAKELVTHSCAPTISFLRRRIRLKGRG